MTAIFTMDVLSDPFRGGNLSPNRRAESPEDPVHGQDLRGPHPLAQAQQLPGGGVAEEDLTVLRELRLEGRTALGGDVPPEGGQRALEEERRGDAGEAQPEVVVEGVAEGGIEPADPLLERPAPEDRHLAHV